MKKKEPKVVKLNIGGNIAGPADFTHVNTNGGLRSIKDNSVDEIWCGHTLNRIPSKERGKFMDELWRVMKKGSKALLIVPYYSSMRAYADFDNEWPPISEMSFICFNKEGREANKIHPELKCDFDFVYGYQPDPDMATRSPEVQSEWAKHRLNSILDLHVTLTKK